MIVERPHQSLPKQFGGWKDLKGAYGLLSNPAVDPHQIGRPHQALTWRDCEGKELVLCVQDSTYLEAARLPAERYLQHSTLAVLPDGGLVGVLNQRFFERPEPPEGETRQQRAQRWRESCVWSESAREVGRAPRGCRFVHVMDRAGDDWEAMQSCREQDAGFVIRAQHNRCVEDDADKLWPHMRAQEVAGTLKVKVHTHQNERSRTSARRAREATVSVRFATVQLDAPRKSPRGTLPQQVQVIYLHEEQPPADEAPVQWMLLSSEPVHSFADAETVVGYYERRWVIEEWHRVLKEGCALKASQLDQPEDIQRHSAILSVVAVRLLQLRDLADPKRAPEQAEDPKALQAAVPPLWIGIVAAMANQLPTALTPKQFWVAIARQGGYIGRAKDPRPGWKVIWRGWYDISQMVRGAELMRQASTSCG